MIDLVYFFKVFIAIIIASVVTAFIFVLCGCQSPPEILKDKDGVIIESVACYNAKLCSYYHKDKPEACIDQWKECRARARYEDCGKEEYRWKNYDCQSCWDKLNSK